MRRPQIVITGGPCGGKTTFLNQIKKEPDLGGKFLYAPEAATLLIDAGFCPGTADFQRGVITVQIALENALQVCPGAPSAILCDRGALDGLAYWKIIGLEENAFHEMGGITRDEILCRYAGVIHLQTAAVGAEERYQQCGRNRPESIEEAIRIDEKIAEVWSTHPGYCLAPNSRGGWDEKYEYARGFLLKCLGVVS